MPTKTTRRAVLAGASAISAAMVPALAGARTVPSGLGHGGPDPVLGLIETHTRNHGEGEEWLICPSMPSSPAGSVAGSS